MIDARGIPTRACPECGCNVLVIHATFDEEYEVAGYFTDAWCAACNTRLTAPTPLDRVEA